MGTALDPEHGIGRPEKSRDKIGTGLAMKVWPLVGRYFLRE
jgi:hypothetical protein